MDAFETVAKNLSRDRKKASLLSSRLLNYADELATALLGYGTLESTDEELELSFRDMKELMDTEKAKGDTAIAATLTEAETALLDAETVSAITRHARIATYLPTLESLDGKCAYFRNAYSDEAFRIFKEYLVSPTVSYTDSPADACREVYTEAASFAILPIESSKEGVITGILKKIEQYELSPVLFCDVTLRGNEETMRFGLYAASFVLTENADGLELVFFTDSPKSLSHLILAASHLGCSLTSCRETGEKQGFDITYRLLFTKEKDAPEDALATLRLLLLCAYPHHQLCGLYKTVYKK